MIEGYKEQIYAQLLSATSILAAHPDKDDSELELGRKNWAIAVY